MATKQKFIDQVGLAYLWTKVVAYVSGKLKYATNEEVDAIIKQDEENQQSE